MAKIQWNRQWTEHENIKTSPAHLTKAMNPIGIEIIQLDLRTKNMRTDSTASNRTLWIEQVSPSIRKEIQLILQLWLCKGNSGTFHSGMSKLQNTKERAQEKSGCMENEDR
jgi:hypothetical protein